MIFFKFMLQE